ncbi:hypothetical protein K501DRAFT_226037 [Backusella circina FSU 941]|nr:hypothetical protein K501DRAFT_226037 [Backusella circina FSU 941]
MIFPKSFYKSNSIRTFQLTVTSGGENRAVAFGPGSVVNGNVTLFLEKPLKVKSIRVVFRCEEWEKKKEASTLFSVESVIWGNREVKELESGNHMYLFAIQLPSSVNYPPTIRDAYLGHRIEYSLQGYLDFGDDMNQQHKTSSIPLVYLPLVQYDASKMLQKTKTLTIDRGDESIEITAKLVNPSYCPGDKCTIKLHTNNFSSYNINHVHIQLLSTATSLHLPPNDLPIASGPSYHHKQRELLNDTIFVSIPKKTQDITTICPLRIPSYCVPTTQSHFGKYIDIAYEIIVTIPPMGQSSVNGWSSTFFKNATAGNGPGSSSSSSNVTSHIFNPQAIRLPLIITTMPTKLPKLHIPFVDESNTEHPTFIPTIESPLPSPTSPMNSSALSWEPGSPVEPEEEFLPQYQEDAFGHLMVPSAITLNTRRSSSIVSAE